MRESRRRGLPDNLDPLVDTLFNVVGILVFIVALTQLQLGDALERLSDLAGHSRERMDQAKAANAAWRAEHAALEAQLAGLEQTRRALLARSSGDLSDGLAEIKTILAQLEKWPERSADGSVSGPAASAAHSKSQVAALQKKIDVRTAELAKRTRYRDELKRVPRELVARLPDPAVVRGREQWILCRYARCYLADRQALVQIGSRAIGRVLDHNNLEQIRPDEFESLAHHFRKRVVGVGNFRWDIVTESSPRARLGWHSKASGLDAAQIEEGTAIRRWLAARSPENDFIRFQVWSDSFEAYLQAREMTEAAGFRAGWRGHEADEELELKLTFGRPPPVEGPVEVD